MVRNSIQKIENPEIHFFENQIDSFKNGSIMIIDS